MKYEQVFDKHKVVVDLDRGIFSVATIEYPKTIIFNIEHSKVIWSFEIPIHLKEAFDVVNLYQECLALANTKNLNPDLLFDLGYTEVK